jgi:hypothetical protein
MSISERDESMGSKNAQCFVLSVTLPNASDHIPSAIPSKMMHKPKLIKDGTIGELQKYARKNPFEML